jgi:S-adenosylmethionine:tRNA ribosyltransferase-isomerase
VTAPAFELPERLEAHEPPEARGLARDEVRLLAAWRSDGGIAHRRFRDLPELLAPGDLLVVNTSATLPAAVPARRPGGEPVELRFATVAPDRPGDDWWVVELRTADGAAPHRGAAGGERLAVEGGAHAELVAPYARSMRLWLARVELPAGAGPLTAYLDRHGRPIRYGYVPRIWPLQAYQTAFSRHPGSAEMPSAARPFTPALVARLMRGGIQVAPVTLHTGVSSPERDEPPYPEAYSVPPGTARAVNAARSRHGRVIAVGTTVVRALETVARDDGTVHPGAGWTSTVVTPESGVRAVDGLITGWHEPRASHLQLLEAVAGPDLLEASYRAALERGYLWHEFGDSHLILR